MKINAINNQSFGALIVNGENQTTLQKNTIKNVLRNKFLTKELLNNLDENYSTDIVVTANPDGQTVKLSLLTTTDFCGVKYIPYDKNGKKFETIIKPKTENSKLNKRNIFIQTAVFLRHALKLDLSSEKNIEEVDKIIYDIFI